MVWRRKTQKKHLVANPPLNTMTYCPSHKMESIIAAMACTTCMQIHTSATLAPTVCAHPS
jgi:hypothetical protein